MNTKLSAAVAATLLCLGATAETTNTVKVTKFHQSYPYSGKATVEYTVGGTLPANAVAEIVLNTDDASATFVQSNIVAGANSHVIDFASSFGGALLLTNASFVVTISASGQGGTGGGLGGVQLWENGPYWAECNVGATKPEEYGYFFWWGDTVGYTRSGGTWNDFGEGYGEYNEVAWVSSTGEQMSGTMFTWGTCPTMDKDDATLQSEGYIDSTGNLAAAHDAATVHLGSPWRTPTGAELAALTNNCTITWTTSNGVHGQLVTGKDAYADRSIFLPAAGECYNFSYNFPDSCGYYWSSTPYPAYSNSAWEFKFDLDFFQYANNGRFLGKSVRPVRSAQ